MTTVRKDDLCTQSTPEYVQNDVLHNIASQEEAEAYANQLRGSYIMSVLDQDRCVASISADANNPTRRFGELLVAEQAVIATPIPFPTRFDKAMKPLQMCIAHDVPVPDSDRHYWQQTLHTGIRVLQLLLDTVNASFPGFQEAKAQRYHLEIDRLEIDTVGHEVEEESEPSLERLYYSNDFRTVSGLNTGQLERYIGANECLQRLENLDEKNALRVEKATTLLKLASGEEFFAQLRDRRYQY